MFDLLMLIFSLCGATTYDDCDRDWLHDPEL